MAIHVARHLTEGLGQSVVVENLAGAGGNIGTAALAKASPDGYTLGVMTVSDMSYASAGQGSLPHLIAEKLAAEAGIRMMHVPYKGAAPAMQDLLANIVDLSFESALTNTVANFQAGKLKVLATTGSVRAPILANIPTVAESGYPSFVAQGWFGFFGLAGLSAPIVKRLNQLATQMLREKAMIERFEKLGIQPDPSSPEQFARFLSEQDCIWATTAKGLNLQLD